MISLKNISKRFGSQVILQNVNLSVFEHEVIALVGPNGSGKSTLLKIMAGILEPDEGNIEMAPGLKIAYFPQEIPQENQKKTCRELLVQKMSVSSEKVLGEIGALCEKLQFPADKIDSSIDTLSGGEKSKLMLMLILKSQADIFLLDEPTNNLDLHGLIFLENFILSNRHSFLIVSHDRKFLGRLAVSVMEISEKTNNIEIYRNHSYTDYLKEQKKKEEKERKKYEDYQNEKKRLLESARKQKQEAEKMARGPKKPKDKDKILAGFKKDQSKYLASKSSAIETRAERLEEVKRPEFHLPLKLQFRFSERSGDIVFRLKDAEIIRGNFRLGPLSWEVNYGDRVAIIGPNGEGKSTLLQILTGRRNLDNGFVQIGSRVKIGYLPQETSFQPDENVLNYFLRMTELDQSNSRRIMARFGFFADDIKISTRDLSPGEKSRLILATLMARDVNCLVIDEPTNHLDPEALDRLEQAFKEFKGTIIMVSHDRYLIDKIGITKTYLVENGKLSNLHDYREYEQKIL